jgi:hypothetical protein
MSNETIEQSAIKLISKYSPWLKENLLIEEHLYEFDDVAGLIELAIAEEREACAEIAAPERLVYGDFEWRVRCEVRDAILDSSRGAK